MITDSLNKDIRNIYKIKLHQNVLSVKDKSKGMENKVFIVKTDKGESVFRIPITGDLQAKREVWASKAWSKIGIPVPKILVFDWSEKLADFKYVIETKIEGKDLEDEKLNAQQLEQVMNDLGKLLKKMHGVKAKQFGFLNGCLKGEFKSLDFLMEWVAENLKRIAAKKNLTTGQIKNIKEYFAANKDVLHYKDSRLLHNDLGDSNCVVKNKKLEGIIDLGDAFAGDPICDVARTYQALTERYPDKTVDLMLREYGKIDMRRFNFYLLYHAVWTTDVYTEEGNLEKIPNSKRLIKKVLSSNLCNCLTHEKI